MPEEERNIEQDPVVFLPYNDLSEATPEEASDRLDYSEELKDLAADIIAGRVKSVIVFRYEHDDPHSLMMSGFFESESAQKHMMQDIDEYTHEALNKGALMYLLGGDEDDA